MYRFLKLVHLWTGLIVGVLFCLSGLSGSALIFADELDIYFNSELWRVEPQSGPIRLNEATNKVRSAFPHRTLLFARLPREPNHSIEYWLTGEPLQRVYVHPWTLEILGRRGEFSGVLGLLHNLHEHWLAGARGLRVNGLLGLVWLFVILIGLWLAWPGWRRLAKALRVPRQRSRRVRWLALHRSVGLMSVLLLAVSALTGTALVFHKQADALLVALFGGPGLPAPPRIEVSAPRPAPKPPGQLLKTAQSVLPDANATWIRFSTRPSAPFIVRFRYPDSPHPNGTSYVALDPVTGEVLLSYNANHGGLGQQLADLKYPLHIGVALGLPGRIVMFLAGFAPTVLFITGVYTWWRKRRRHDAHSHAA